MIECTIVVCFTFHFPFFLCPNLLLQVSLLPTKSQILSFLFQSIINQYFVKQFLSQNYVSYHMYEYFIFQSLTFNFHLCLW